jgi:hypothetical protein
VALHFLLLPNWQERWVGMFYLICGVCASAAIEAVRTAPNNTQNLTRNHPLQDLAS